MHPPSKVRLCVLLFSALVAMVVLGAGPAHSQQNPISTALDEAFQTKDFAKAFQLAWDMARRNDPAGQTALGDLYSGGRGVPQDDAQAVTWYRKAADLGDAKGQFLLGTMYYRGRGAQKDLAEALIWFRKAAEQDYIPAQFYVGYMNDKGESLRQDSAEAARWYRQAFENYRKGAERTDPATQVAIGYLYEEGQGTQRDYVQAERLYRAAANRDHTAAQSRLCYLLYSGVGVKRDATEALKWCAKAAEQGDAWAQNQLGYMYEAGIGTQKDLAQAKNWYEKSATQGQSYAAERLKNLAGAVQPTAKVLANPAAELRGGDLNATRSNTPTDVLRGRTLEELVGNTLTGFLTNDAPFSMFLDAGWHVFTGSGALRDSGIYEFKNDSLCFRLKVSAKSRCLMIVHAGTGYEIHNPEIVRTATGDSYNPGALLGRAGKQAGDPGNLQRPSVSLTMVDNDTGIIFGLMKHFTPTTRAGPRLTGGGLAGQSIPPPSILIDDMTEADPCTDIRVVGKLSATAHVADDAIARQLLNKGRVYAFQKCGRLTRVLDGSSVEATPSDIAIFLYDTDFNDANYENVWVARAYFHRLATESQASGYQNKPAAAAAEQRRKQEEQQQRAAQEQQMADQRRVQDEQARQRAEQARLEAERRNKEAQDRKAAARVIFSRFAEQNHIAAWPALADIEANPFIYEGKTIGIRTSFMEMLSKDRGLFGVQEPILVTEIPPGRFARRAEILLAGRVMGKENVKLPFLGDVLVPHLGFVDTYICIEAGCEDVLSWTRAN